MAAVRKYAKDTGGALAAGGTATALTITTNQAISSGHQANGHELLIRATAASTGAATIAVDGLTAVPIKKLGGLAIQAGDWIIGDVLHLVYSSVISGYMALNIGFGGVGTFTPAFSASGSTFSYSAREGIYVKIGRLVYFSLYITLNTSGNTLTGNFLTITGLPYTIINSFVVFPILWQNATTSYYQMLATGSGGSTSLGVNGQTSATASLFGAFGANANAALHATNGSTLITHGTYYTTA
jgi:hypothetical protein